MPNSPRNDLSPRNVSPRVPRSNSQERKSSLENERNKTQFELEQVSFYKQRNKQLQNRIDEHIKINQELKEKVETLIQKNTGSVEVEFYKGQMDKLKQDNEEVMKIVNLLTQKNEKLTIEIQKLHDSSTEFKYVELDNRMQQMQRKLTHLQKQNGLMEA